MRTEHLCTGIDASLEAEIDLPDGAIRAGLITLHGASNGSLRQPLFRHVAVELIVNHCHRLNG